MTFNSWFKMYVYKMVWRYSSIPICNQNDLKWIYVVRVVCSSASAHDVFGMHMKMGWRSNKETLILNYAIMNVKYYKTVYTNYETLVMFKLITYYSRIIIMICLILWKNVVVCHPNGRYGSNAPTKLDLPLLITWLISLIMMLRSRGISLRF